MNCIPSPIYKRRNPQKTVLYQVVQNTFLEWSGNYSLRHDEVLPKYVEKEFKDYFKCGILAHGFARAYCSNCRGDFIVAYSCKKRGVCPSCNTDEQNIEAATSKLNLQPQAKTGSKTWARLIAKVYEVDPLKCEGCGAEMKLIAFQGHHQYHQDINSPRRRS